MEENPREASAVFNLPPQMPECRTYCIIGQGRGGTTMIANLVEMLGVYLFKSTKNNAEDRELREAYRGYDYQLRESDVAKNIRNEIEKRNVKCVWAWKGPQLGLYLHKWYQFLRNPFWIYVIRDHLASALTEVRLGVVKDAIAGLAIKCENELHYQEFITRVNKEKHPILIISYERARLFKGKFLLSLIAFLGTNPTLQQMGRAVDYIKDVGPLQGPD